MSLTWKDLAQDVGKAAPIIGTMLGGPVGAAVGGLVSMALGCDNTPDAVQAAIASDPQAAEKLAEAQLNAKVQLQQLQVQAAQAQMANDLSVFQAEVSDRQSARQMQNAPDWWIRPLITIMLITGACTIVALIFLPATRDVIKDPVATGMIGMLIGLWFKELQASIAYYFGATKEGSETAKQIAAFAIAPGSVTSGDNTPAINNGSVAQ